MMLSESLKKYRNKHILKRIILCLLMLTAITLFVIYYRETIFSYELVPPFAIACIGFAVYSVPFILFKIPHLFFDSSWTGVVTEVNVETGRGTHVVGGKIGQYYKNDIVLTIEKYNGKTIKHVAKSLGVKERVGVSSTILGNVHSVATGKIENHVDEFSVGDKVYHFYGFEYNFYVREPQNEHKHCIVCGASNNLNREYCLSCHHELLEMKA